MEAILAGMIEGVIVIDPKGEWVPLARRLGPPGALAA